MHPAQNFTLPDQTGTLRPLADFKGKWIILYFYPKDDTPGCTLEACSFKDSNEQLLAKNAVVVGVSKDSVKSHAKFAADYNLPFILLSDPDKTVINMYGCWGKKMFGVEGVLRRTFIIDPNFNIVKEYKRVTPAQHATQILDDLAALQSASTN